MPSTLLQISPEKPPAVGSRPSHTVFAALLVARLATSEPETAKS